MASTLTDEILSRTEELCANIIPMMENDHLTNVTTNVSTAVTTNVTTAVTTTVTIGSYTVTITIAKDNSNSVNQNHVPIQSIHPIQSIQPILGKRCYDTIAEEPNTDRNVYSKYNTDANQSDTRLYNTYGHNFTSMYS